MSYARSSGPAASASQAKSWIVFVGGLLVLGWGGWLYVQDRAFVTVARPVVGTLIKEQYNLRTGHHDAHSFWSGTVAYTVDGSQVQSNCTWQTGDLHQERIQGPISLLYDPQQPNHCKLDVAGALYRDSWHVLAGGAICTALGLIFVLGDRYYQRRGVPAPSDLPEDSDRWQVDYL